MNSARNPRWKEKANFGPIAAVRTLREITAGTDEISAQPAQANTTLTN